jgi:hypothetical protein
VRIRCSRATRSNKFSLSAKPQPLFLLRGQSITKKDSSGRCIYDGCALEAAATLGFIGGIGAQAFHDYSNGDFSRRSIGQNIATYSLAGTGGAVIAAETVVAGFGAAAYLGTAVRIATAGLAAGTLTAGTDVGNNYLLGQPTDRGGEVALHKSVGYCFLTSPEDRLSAR